MFSFFKSGPTAMQVNELDIPIESKETILSAALRNGINFPYSCKVGGCAVCKCKLTNGKIKAFSDASYLLSAEEVQSGYILACQSVPKTSDVTVEVDLTQVLNRQIRGKVIAQEKLTHDITALELSLDEPALFKAGQYAMLTLDCLEGVSRAYSFASKPQIENSTVRFFIRHVPGGALSSLINTKNVLGEGIEIDGPMGDFYLNDSDKPMLMIGGGSGLAPIVSILEKAKEDSCQRPVIVLLGARTQADIYCLDEMQQLALSWPATFEFSQILSEEPEQSTWKGHRGFIGDYLVKFCNNNSQAYLCGPPAMIDDCIDKLSLVGISKSEIFADRFFSNNNSAD